ncbi:hypothetical protein ACFLTJ_02575 [Chloroflexota bacterium]
MLAAVLSRLYHGAPPPTIARITPAALCSYAYPDLLYWQAPSSQLKALGRFNNKWTLQGLGDVIPLGSEYLKSGNNPVIWQWFKLHFGQMVLLKRGRYVDPIPEKLLPVMRQTHDPLVDTKINYIDSQKQKRIQKSESVVQKLKQPTLWDDNQSNDEIEAKEISVEDAVDFVVKNRFKVNDIRSLLLTLTTQENGEEKSMLFAKLIAKARIARIKH